MKNGLGGRDFDISFFRCLKLVSLSQNVLILAALNYFPPFCCFNYMCVCALYILPLRKRANKRTNARHKTENARDDSTHFSKRTHDARKENRQRQQGFQLQLRRQGHGKSVHFNGVCGFREDVPYTQLTAAPPRARLLGQNKYGWAAAAHTAFR